MSLADDEMDRLDKYDDETGADEGDEIEFVGMCNTYSDATLTSAFLPIDIDAANLNDWFYEERDGKQIDKEIKLIEEIGDRILVVYYELK